MFRRNLFIIGAGLLSLATTSCSSSSGYSAPQRRYVPRVQIPDPSSMSENEQRYLPEVQDALGEAGYRPVFGPAEFRLAFLMEDGPVNADTEMTLYRGDVELAHSKARIGGPRIIFSRSKVVQESFHKCLTEFESKIPRPDGSAYTNGAADYSGVGSDNGGYDEGTFDGSRRAGGGQQDWQTGW